MNERRERLRREAWRWLVLARQDLAAAAVLAEDAGVPPRISCFHAQQAAEKALKAVLVAEGVDPLRVHDLGSLAERCRSPEVASLDTAVLDRCSRWAIAGRYPADIEEAVPSHVEECRATAEQVISVAVEVVTRLVGPAGE